MSAPDEGRTKKRSRTSSFEEQDNARVKTSCSLTSADDVTEEDRIWERNQEIAYERAAVVEQELERAQHEQTLWIDWTKAGAKTFKEYKTLARAVDYQAYCRGSSECGRYLPFILCSPAANLLVSDEFTTGHVREEWAYQAPPDYLEYEFLEATSNCSHHINPMYYDYLGEWKYMDIVGPIEDKDQGLRRAVEDASNDLKSMITSIIRLYNDSLDISGHTRIPEIREELRTGCLSKVCGVLGVATAVSTSLAFDGSTAVGSPCVSFARSTKCSFVVCQSEGENSYQGYPFLAVEPTFAPSDRLVPCVQWHHYLKFGGVEPTCIKRPDDEEIEESVKMMTHLLGCCFAYGLIDIVVSDSRSATAIHFDMNSATRDRTCGQVGFRSRTTYYNSVDLPMSLMLAAIGWQQWKRVEDGSYRELWKEVVNASYSLRLTNQEIVDGRQHFPGGSSVAVHVPKLECDFLQDEGCLNRVVRMTREQYAPLFPKDFGQTVVVKIMDFANLEVYFEENKRDEFDGFTWEEFRKICFNRYATELECYKRIGKFNKTARRKIHAPKLLDYGLCCIDDDAGALFDGYYLVLEDLGSNTCSSDNEEGEPEDKVEEELKLLRSIGIDHHDVEWRNIIVRDGQTYVYDFNFAKLGELVLRSKVEKVDSRVDRRDDDLV